jgi:hypothetical protein
MKISDRENNVGAKVSGLCMPGFSAERSVYVSKSVYRAAGAQLQTVAVFPALSGDGLASQGSFSCGYGLNQFAVGSLPQSRAFNEQLPVADIARTVVPMSVSGHQTDLSGQCYGCENQCLVVWSIGCENTVIAGCAGLTAIPFVGGIAAAACMGIGLVACYFAYKNCLSNCRNIGSPCCPVACGNGCCNYNELCLDTEQALCCSPGTLPCTGPQESCYDPRTEKCLPSGVGCPFGQECGNNCCGTGAVCIDSNSGACCDLLTGVPCGNECCDGRTQQCTTTGCCPKAQACGDTCCPGGSVCGANGQCVVAQTCQPGEFLCVSQDKTKQRCCAGDQACCEDGSCCGGSSNPGYQCCGSRGCVLQTYCVG